MKEKIYRFMQGRYGFDHLSKAMMIIAFILMFVTSVFKIDILIILGWIFLILSYMRTLSRNIPKRYQENQKYLHATGGIRRKIKSSKIFFYFSDTMAGFKDKTHHFYRCPSCHQKIRVPKGRGKIAITCPTCHTEFIRKT